MESGLPWIFTADVSISQGMRVLIKQFGKHIHNKHSILSVIVPSFYHLTKRVSSYGILRICFFYRLNNKKPQIDIHIYLRKIFNQNINFSLIAICGNPPLIERASVIANSTAEGGVAIYTCSSGTVTEGSTSIVCQNDGFWSHTNLYCRRKRL